MRLGGQLCFLNEDSLAKKIYGSDKITERHRHRYEVNVSFIPSLEKAGLKISGVSAEEKLCEMVELSQDEHPWFVACQFHPEFTSTPQKAHPLFKAYINAAISYANQRTDNSLEQKEIA